MWKPRKTVGQMVEEAKTRIENLSVEEVEAEMARGDVQVVDIRDVRERKKLGFIPGSTHVPRGMLEFWLDQGRSDQAHHRVLRRRAALRARRGRAPRDGVPERRPSRGRLHRLGRCRPRGRPRARRPRLSLGAAPSSRIGHVDVSRRLT